MADMPKMSCTYANLRRFARFVIHVFFKKVEILHPEHIPEEGPLIIVSNHNNQFIDGTMVIKAVRKRPIRSIIAEKSIHRPIIGHVARALNSIPVIRPQDRAKTATGAILDIDETTCILTGEGTRFTEDCTVGFAITIKGIGLLKIEEIISDTELKMLNGEPWIQAFKEKKRKGTDSFPFKVTPKINQHEVYDAVYDALLDNATISIFPEGGSHDNAQLLKLKPGVAVMALGAQSKGAKVQIMAIGINYFAGHQFRSNVVIECGLPFEIDPSIIDTYNSGDTEEEKTANRRKAYSDLMVDVQAALQKVTFNAPSYRTLQILRTARRLYQGDINLNLEDYTRLYRRFADGWTTWRESRDFQKLEQDIGNYLKAAAAAGFTDKQIKNLPDRNDCTAAFKTLFDMLVSVFIIIPVFIITLPGLILISPMLIRINMVVRREIAKALAGSSVKQKGLDVAQSQRALLTVKYYPTLILFYAILSGVLIGLLWDTEEFTGEWHEPITDNLWWIWPLCSLVLWPLYTYMGVKVLEIVTYRIALFPSQMHILRRAFAESLSCCCFCCRSNSKKRKKSISESSNLRMTRRNLAVRTQQVIQDLTKDDQDWQADPIISNSQLQEQREKEAELLYEHLQRSESLDPRAVETFVQENLKEELV